MTVKHTFNFKHVYQLLIMHFVNFIFLKLQIMSISSESMHIKCLSSE